MIARTNPLRGQKRFLDDLIQRHGMQWILDHAAVLYPATSREFLARLDSVLDDIIRSLEDDAEALRKATEEEISRQITRLLQQTGYEARSESHVRGHVDVVVESADRKRRWLAESKIHRDYDYLDGGLRQLLSRYTSGRDTEGGLLVFVKGKGCDRVMQRWRDYLELKRTERLKEISSDPTARCFRSMHEHDAGCDYTVRHIGVHLYFWPRDKAAQQRKARSAVRKGGPRSRR